MSSTFRPWQLLVVTAAGWINRDQQAVIHYLQEENRILREHLGKKRLLLTDDQRRVQCRERLGGMLRYYYRQAA